MYILTQIPLKEINFVPINKHGNVDTDTSINGRLWPLSLPHIQVLAFYYLNHISRGSPC